MKKNTIKILILLGILLIPYVVNGENNIENKYYSLSASDSMVLDNKQQKIRAEGNIVFKTSDITLESTKLEVDIEKNLIYASGDKITLTGEEQVLTGTYLEYNYKENTGTFHTAYGSSGDINFKGASIEIINSEKTDYEAKNVMLTTCQLTDEPHYHLAADSIIMYEDKKIVATNVKVYLGKNPILYLPSYVINIEDEEEGKGKFTSSFPVPEIGYNSEDGINLELDYGYQWGERFEGDLYSRIEQTGGKEVSLDNKYRLNENFDLINSIIYKKDDEQEKGIIKGGFNYNNDDLNIETTLDRDFLEGKYGLSNIIALKKSDLNFKTEFNYDFSSERREEKIYMDYTPADNYKFKFNQKYINEGLDKQLYSLNNNNKLADIELVYKKGYEVDYSPYLIVDTASGKFSTIDYDMSFGLGNVENENITVNKLKYNLKAEKNIEMSDSFKIGLSGNYTNNTYYEKDTKTYNLYQAKVSGKHEYDINQDLAINTGITYHLVDTSGDPLLPSDKVEREQYLSPALSIDYYDREELAGWTLTADGKYQLEDKDWKSVEISAKRKYDCYNYSLSYDIVDNSLGFGIEF
ncbi:MAG: hypothetical protein ACOCRZ_06765 [Halothermotrichaceae bacterium]